MRAGLATGPADRMTRVVMMTSAALSGVIALGIALPLAVSSPYPTAGQGDWIIQATLAQPTAAQQSARDRASRAGTGRRKPLNRDRENRLRRPARSRRRRSRRR